MTDPANRAMVSEVSICNQALTWLGQDPITSLDELSTAASWCRANYGFLRDAVLEERMWTFATFRDVWDPENGTPAWGGGYAFNIPDDVLGVYRVYRPGSHQDPIEISWRVEEHRVIADVEQIWVWGLRRETNTSKFSMMFVQALAARIAADAAVPLTGNRQLQADLWGLYEEKLTQAAARDGMQGSSDFITQRQLTGARYRGGYLGRRV